MRQSPLLVCSSREQKINFLSGLAVKPTRYDKHVTKLSPIEGIFLLNQNSTNRA